MNDVLSLAVVDFRHEYKPTGRFPSDMVFPTLLGRFTRLLSLQLTVSIHPEFNTIYKVDWSLVSKEIRSLDLQFANAFLEFLEIKEGPVTDPETMNEDNCRLLSINTMFPKLETLNIMHGFESKPLKSIDFATKLPSTLVTLICDRNIFFGPEGISYLPRSLETLSLRLAEYKGDWNACAPKFPPSLTALSLDSVKSMSVLDYLPNTLQRLHFLYDCVKMDVETDVSKLPPNLVELRSNTSEWTPESIEKLPRSLTILMCSRTTMEDGSPLVNLPPSLIRLEQQGYFRKKPEPHMPTRLPRTVIEMPSDWAPVPESWSDLPPRLGTICLAASASKATPDQFSSLPKQIKWLTATADFDAHLLPHFPAQHVIKVDLYLFRIESSLWQAVSAMPNLKWFKLMCWQDETPAPISLISSTAKLAFFSLSTKHLFQHIGMIGQEHWSSELEALNLDLSAVRKRPDDIDEWFAGLPRGLRSLHIQWMLAASHGYYVPDSIIQHLPPKLERLYIHSFGCVTADTIKALPRTVIDAELLGYVLGTYTLQDVLDYLPRTISRIHFPKTQNWNPNDTDMGPILKHFPLLRNQCVLLSAEWTSSTRKDYERNGKFFNVIGFLAFAIAAGRDPLPFYPPYRGLDARLEVWDLARY